MPPRRDFYTPGDLVRTDLPDGSRGYAQKLIGPLYRFFHHFDETGDQPDHSPDAIVSGFPEAFRIWVRDGRKSNWHRSGFVPLSPSNLGAEQVFFKRDAISGVLTLYQSDATTGEVREWPATRDEIADVECAAVWEKPQVEERLLDLKHDRVNEWVRRWTTF